MATPAEDFRLKEFEVVRKEIELQLGALRRPEDYCLLAVDGVWTWLLTAQLANSLASFLPFVLAVLFYVKRLSLEANIAMFHTYIMDHVEQGLG